MKSSEILSAGKFSPRLSLLWFDVLVVLVFVLIGRRTHDEGSALGGVVSTAAPFLLALVLGWLLSGSLQEPLAGKAGIGTWFITLVVGMLLRRFLFDGGTAPAFVVVASVFLFLTMVTWRFVAWRKFRPAANRAAAADGVAGGAPASSNLLKKGPNA